jgi:DNA topoisomerase IB
MLKFIKKNIQRSWHDLHVEAALALHILQVFTRKYDKNIIRRENNRKKGRKMYGICNYHKKRVWGLNKTLELMLPFLKLCWWVEQIDIVLKNLSLTNRSVNERNRS